MKKVVFILTLAFFSIGINAQEKKKKEEKVTRIVTVTEDGERTEVIVPGVKIEVDGFNDTITTVTLGRRQFEVIEENNKAHIRMVRLPIDRFKGHYAGFEMGFNGYMSSDFTTSLPASDQFMDLNQGKSITVGINFMQYNIDLQRYKNNLGLVIGAGMTWYNYRTDLPYYFKKDPDTNITFGEPVEETRSVSKNKITSTFVNIPLLLEWQIPGSNDVDRFFISAGPYVGFRLWGHTKMVFHEDGSKQKDKNRKDININPFQYGVMVRMGYRFIKLYGTYNFSTLYSHNKGPELHPYTVGLTLLSF